MNMDIRKIMNLLPHSYPFLLVDKVTEIVPGDAIVAVKNVTFNEPFFQGHFPGVPIMPGVLILEALAQASGLCVLSGNPALEDMENNASNNGQKDIVYFALINSAKFRKPVIPGNVLILQSKLTASKGGLYKFNCSAFVGDTMVAEGEIGLMKEGKN